MHKYETASPTNLAATRVPVAIVGARGYAGLELSRLLLKHEGARLAGCYATDASFKLEHSLLERSAQLVPTWSLKDFDAHLDGLHTLFLATPAEVSLELAPRALAKGVNVVDLSGAFRLKSGSREQQQATYRKWYGFEHAEPALLAKAEYGLVPWVGKLQGQSLGQGQVQNQSADLGQTAHLIANPGCYASAVSMALLPLLQTQAIDPSSLVIDAKSGTSGAGRKASENLLFTEVEGECLPYKVAKHQHTPEIEEAAQVFADAKIEPFFTTHLLNVRRGIIASIYARLSKNALGATDAESEARIDGAFREAYASYPLVRFGALGRPETDALLSLKRVVGTPRTHIAFRVEGEKLFLFSLIDNLVKGAASQAVENFNRLTGLPIDFGLTDWEGLL